MIKAAYPAGWNWLLAAGMMVLLWGYSRWLTASENRVSKPNERTAKLLVWTVERARLHPQRPSAIRRNRFAVAKRTGRATANPSSPGDPTRAPNNDA